MQSLPLFRKIFKEAEGTDRKAVKFSAVLISSVRYETRFVRLVRLLPSESHFITRLQEMNRVLGISETLKRFLHLFVASLDSVVSVLYTRRFKSFRGMKAELGDEGK